MLKPSSRLFGRLQETAALTDAYGQVAATQRPQMVLLSGPPGIGKSALVHRFHRLLRVGRHRFAKGKCEKAQRHTALAPVIQLLRQLVDAALADSDAALAILRERLSAEVGGEVRAIIDLLPELEILVGRMPPLPELPVALAQARLQRSLLATFAAFAGAEQPLILFIDDLQWADPATLALLTAFAGDARANILLVVSYRDEGTAAMKRSDGIIGALRSAPIPPSEIALEPLDFKASRELLASLLEAPEAAIDSLALFIHEQARGNPFFIEQFLRRLQEEQILTWDETAGLWSWDPDRFGEVDGSEDVLDFIARRLQRLESDERTLMAAAGMLGGHGDIALLASLLGKPQADTEDRATALAEVGLLTLDGVRIGFSHDRILEAAMQLTPRQERPAIHARIARLLIGRWREPSPERLFVIASHVLRATAGGAPILLKQGTRRRFATILCDAAQHARAAAASDQAAAYLDVAVALVEEDWWSTAPALAFHITYLRCESLLLRGRIAEADIAIPALLDRALENRDRAAVFRLFAALRTVHSDYEGATSAALSGLALMGHPLSRSPSDAECKAASDRIRVLMGDRPDEAFVELPLADDPDVALVTSLLSLLLVCVFSGDSLRFLHLAKIVELTITRGVTADSVYGLAWYGVMISDFYDRYEDGFAYGQTALALIDRHGVEGQRTGALVAVDQLSPWTRSFDFALARVHEAIAGGDAAGDLAMTCFARNHLVSDLIQMGRPLAQVEAEAAKGLELTRRIQFQDIEMIILAQDRFARELKNGRSATDRSASCVSNSASTRFLVGLYDGIAAYMFGDIRHAAKILEEIEPLTWSMAAHIDLVYFTLFSALAAARNLPAEAALSVMEPHRDRLAGWTPLNPSLFEHKLLMVDGEMARLQGESLEACRLFDRAIVSSGSFVHERGLARELAGQHCTEQGMQGLAQRYFEEAASDYRLWGAVAKAQSLPPPDIDAVRDLMAQDLLVAMDSVRGITEQVGIDPLRTAVLRAMMIHAAAARGQLLLLHDGDAVIEAVGEQQEDRIDITLRTIIPTPERVNPDILADTIVGRELILVDRLAHEDDPVAANGLRAILSIPLVAEDRLVGIIYLEGDPSRSLTRQRKLPVLKLLAEQAAICLEREARQAQIFENYERRSEAEAALRIARAELAHTSHLATMGGMAASIAHEINQPLASIIGNAAACSRWLKHAEPNVEEALANLKGITASGKRAAEIVTALRSLARRDNILREPLSLHVLIHDVLELTRVEIEASQVVLSTDLDQGEGRISGDRIQLQQLIQNLVKNAIEAMANTDVAQRFLHIRCRESDGAIVTRVEDRGCGIAPDALEKIFTPLFTTKSKGMGMGLAICNSIVAAHGGKLSAGQVDDGGTFFEFSLPLQ